MNQLDAAPSPVQPLVSARCLSKAFGGRRLFKDVSFDLHAGQSVLLKGNNGAGKTTLLNILTGLMVPDSGTIEYRIANTSSVFSFGKAKAPGATTVLRFSGESMARHGVGRTWQDVRLFPSQTVGDNVAVGFDANSNERILAGIFAPQRQFRTASAQRQRARDLLETLGLKGRDGSLANQVSLGQAKRVSIARALAAQTRILFLDEPLAGLDSSGIEEALAVLKLLVSQHQMTLVIIEHTFNHRYLDDWMDVHWELREGRLKVSENRPTTVSTAQHEQDRSDAMSATAMTILSSQACESSRKPLDRGAHLTRLRNLQPVSQTGKPVLELRNVMARRGLRDVLGMDSDDANSGLSLQIMQGETLIIEAPNGWGKSSLLEVISGSLPVESGQIFYFGEDITSWPVWKRAQAGISVLATGLPGLGSLTVAEIFRLANLRGLPPIVQELANRRFDTLSGGEQQRVMLSAIRPGRMVILDEPFNALDESTTSLLNLPARLAGFEAGLVLLPSAATIINSVSTNLRIKPKDQPVPTNQNFCFKENE